MALHPSWASSRGHKGYAPPGARDLGQELSEEHEDEDAEEAEYDDEEPPQSSEVDAWDDEDPEAEDDEEDSLLAVPGNRRHVLTDWGWLFLLVIQAAGGNLMVAKYTRLDQWDSNIEKFFPHPHPIDSQGNPCSDRQLLFFCNVNGHLNTSYRVCRNNCPTSDMSLHPCYDPELQFEQTVRDYPTYSSSRYGMRKDNASFCMPENATLRDSLREMIGTTSWSGQAIRCILALLRDWQVMILSFTYIIILGYMFLFALDHEGCAKLGVQIFIACEISFPIYFTYKFGKELVLGVESDGANYITGNGQRDSMVCGALLFVSCVFVVAGAVLCEALDTAISCLRAAAECIFNEPTLLIEPIVGVLVKMVVLVWSTMLLVMLMSQSVQEKDGFIDEFVPTMELIVVTGLWMLQAVWLLWTFHHVSMYVLSYSAQLWYYREKAKYMVKRGLLDENEVPDNRWAIFRAYGSALRYHMGSIAKGSVLSLIFGLPRMWAHTVEEGRNDRRCIMCLRVFCWPCWRWKLYDGFLKYTGKDAYMDMAMNSYGFWHSAQRVQGLFDMKEMKSAKKARNEMARAMNVLNFVVLGGFVSSTVFFSYCLCKSGVIDPDSDWKPMAIFSGIVSMIVGANFLVVLDCVGDMLFFTMATEQLRWRTDPANAEALQRVERMRSAKRQLASETERSGGGVMHAISGAASWAFSRYEELEDQDGQMHRDVFTPKAMRKMLKQLGYEYYAKEHHKKHWLGQGPPPGARPSTASWEGADPER